MTDMTNEGNGNNKNDNKNDSKGGLPLRQEVFLESGVHIGTKIRTHDMRRFVFKRRDDGLFILDLRKSADRLMMAAKLMSKYKPEEVLIVASRVYSGNPAARFAMLTGMSLMKGRFVPGTMTNLTVKGFVEPKLVFVCDPKSEREAIAESAKNGVPVIALCDTDNETKFIDFIVPINNKGKRSLALIFYVLTREILMAHGKIKSYDDFTHDIGYFEQMGELEPKRTESVNTNTNANANTESPGSKEKEMGKEPNEPKVSGASAPTPSGTGLTEAKTGSATKIPE